MSVAMASVPGQGGAFDFLKPIARGFATIAIAVIGIFLCTTVGSLAYPVGASLGDSNRKSIRSKINNCPSKFKHIGK